FAYHPKGSRSEIHGDIGWQEITASTSLSTLVNNDRSQRKHLFVSCRTGLMRHLQIVLAANVFVLPGLQRPDEHELIQFSRELGEQTRRHANTGFDGADVEIRRRPFAFFDVKRVYMRCATAQIDEDAKVRRSARADILVSNNV